MADHSLLAVVEVLLQDNLEVDLEVDTVLDHIPVVADNLGTDLVDIHVGHIDVEEVELGDQEVLAVA